MRIKFLWRMIGMMDYAMFDFYIGAAAPDAEGTANKSLGLIIMGTTIKPTINSSKDLYFLRNHREKNP